jgi:hypothetical protein
VVGEADGSAVGVGVGDNVGASVGIATHPVCADWPLVQVLPAQSWHTQYDTLSWYLPDGQWKQVVCFTIAVILPTAQSWQVLPVDRWYFPTTQSLQAADAPAEYWPLSHSVQLAAL